MKTPTNPLPDDQRLLLIEKLLDQWSPRRHIPACQMRQALSVDELKRLMAEITREPIPRMPTHIARAFKPYIDLLRVADSLEYRADNTPGASRQVSRCVGLYPYKSLRHRAETAYERALEKLEEIVEDDPGVVFWLDRDVCFSQQEGIWADSDLLPRLRTSRSTHALRNGLPKRSRPSMVVDALLASKERLMYEMAKTEALGTAASPSGKPGYRGIGSLPVTFDPDEE